VICSRSGARCLKPGARTFRDDSSQHAGIGRPADKPFASTVSPRPSDAAWIRAMAKDAMSERLAEFREQFNSLGGDLTSEPNLDDYREVRDAFSTFKRLDDPQNPIHRSWLLVILAHIVFGRRVRGPEPKWDVDQFKADIAVAKQAPPHPKSDLQIAKVLIEDKHKKFDGRYKDESVDALRHRLREIKQSNWRNFPA
jgi:hypothetical protein